MPLSQLDDTTLSVITAPIGPFELISAIPVTSIHTRGRPASEKRQGPLNRRSFNAACLAMTP
jgi:hypothetical protein